jgi:hypothetical protein
MIFFLRRRIFIVYRTSLLGSADSYLTGELC